MVKKVQAFQGTAQAKLSVKKRDSAVQVVLYRNVKVQDRGILVVVY